jgi:formylglycine-generating enzyme required for sulfatase activity
MHGNVYEWCRDWYHRKLPGGTDPDLSAVLGSMPSRVRRGGAWCDEGQPCRSARRLRFEPERRSDHIGFRGRRCSAVGDAVLRGAGLSMQLSESSCPPFT